MPVTGYLRISMLLRSIGTGHCNLMIMVLITIRHKRKIWSYIQHLIGFRYPMSCVICIYTLGLSIIINK